MKRKILSLMLVAVLLLSLIIPVPTEAAFENTYTLTGNQRKDILGVALTQLDYREGSDGKHEFGNDTKYGDWYGLPYNEWCAMFVSWCARQADISTRILKNSCRATPRQENFNIPWYKGTEYTPKPGDLFFKPGFTHVGLVYEVRGDVVITIEGNVNYEGTSDKDGFTVTFLERKIVDCVFGVPAYEGCDTCPVTGGDHEYTRKHDGGHPHANYFVCGACGDKYYTGSQAHLTDCASCMRCGCSTEYAGLYKVVDVENFMVLRDGHATRYDRRSIADLDQTVEVLAGNGSWAHIVDGPNVYYGSMAYLKRYVPKPDNVKADSASYLPGEAATIAWDASQTATAYQVVVRKDGKQIASTDIGNKRSYTLEELKPGSYEIAVTASYAGTVSEAGTCSFRVLAVYELAYDGREGTNVPEKQQKIEGQSLTLSDLVPEKDGYRFLGWNDDPAARHSVYQPGDTWNGDSDTTMYAIWQSETAVPESLEIVSPAQTVLYFVGDALDTTGLELMLHYSDGSAMKITGGYEVTGFSSDVPTEVAVTLTYEGVSAQYSVTVVDFIPGDVDKDRKIDKADVMQLLWHISFPEMFPIEVPADFTGDNKVTKDDVMQLLWHISFPEMFPLT